MLRNVQIRDGHDNFFTPLRLIFALMVVFGHAYVIALRDIGAEPSIFFEYKASYIAVNLFFIASGFLVTKSILYRAELSNYTSARSLRIFPALLVHVLFVMFVMGPFVTNLPLREFFSNPQFYTQPFQVLSFYETNMVMPGALETNDEQIASGALWTLRYEVLAYIGTAVAFSLGLMKKKWMLAAQFVGFALLWPVAHITGMYEKIPATGQAILRFGLCYGLGAAIYAYRNKLTFNILGIPLLGMVTCLFHGTVLFEPLLTIWLGYSIFWAAYVKIPALNRLQSMSDVSYGIYIYHWCILQWLFYEMPGLNVMELTAMALPITVILAHASWHLVEKPMLKRKTWFAKFLKFGRGKQKSYDKGRPVILD